MRTINFFTAVGVGLVAASCSTSPIAVALIGPNPARGEIITMRGELQVFSRLDQESDNQNQGSTDPVWYQHADYSVYGANGKLVARVDNKAGHYEQSPRRIALPPGQYLVRAPAQDYLRVEVPVKIERGRLTRVHLDDEWQPPPATPKTELVSTPNGEAVGWKANSRNNKEMPLIHLLRSKGPLKPSGLQVAHKQNPQSSHPKSNCSDVNAINHGALSFP